MKVQLHVVGGGLAGMVAAVTAAERGADATIYEAQPVLGGRARSGADSGETWGANYGPHVVHSPGVLVSWLSERGLLPPTTAVPFRTSRYAYGGSLHRVPESRSLSVARALRGEAPVDTDFRSWAESRFGTGTAARLCRIAGAITFDADPGSWSAAFVWERLVRASVRSRAHLVRGGWQRVVDGLERHARSLGVTIETGARVRPDELTGGPVVVATEMRAARTLLDDPSLEWPGARTALLDVGYRGEARDSVCVVYDLEEDLETCVLSDRLSVLDRSLAPDGHHLLQASLGISTEDDLHHSVGRIEAAFDKSYAGWREGEVWRRETLAVGRSGALDPPGATWRDRPAIARGEGIHIAGDAVRAPGYLAEVSVNSGVRAAMLAVDDASRRVYAPPAGWPHADLDPVRRLRVLAATLPVGVVRETEVSGHVDDVWRVEAGRETDPYLRIETSRGGLVRGAAASPAGTDKVRLAVLVGSRRRAILPGRRILERLAARRLRRLGTSGGAPTRRPVSE